MSKFIILPLLIFIMSCTINGVEVGLLGEWEIIDYSQEGYDDFDNIDGTITFYNDDTFTLNMTLNYSGFKRQIESSAVIREASSIEKTLYIDGTVSYDNNFSMTFSENFNYILNISGLTLESESLGFFELQK